MERSLLVRIDRVLEHVTAVTKAAGQSGERFVDEYLAMVNDSQTIDAVELCLKDADYQAVAEIRDLYAMVCGTTKRAAEFPDYGEHGNSPYLHVQKKAWADLRPDLLRWLRKLKEALLKAREVCSARQKRPKPKSAIFDAATGKLTLNRTLIKLGDSERRVLNILVENQAASFAELENANAPARSGLAPVAKEVSQAEEIHFPAWRRWKRRLLDNDQTEPSGRAELRQNCA